MKALSIMQPWAWLIVNGYKPVENRSWGTTFRGRFLVHASKGFDKEGYLWVVENADRLGVPVGLNTSEHPHPLPLYYDFMYEPDFRGGIVGEAFLHDCKIDEEIDRAIFEGIEPSCPWAFGPFCFWLRDAKPLPFRPIKGQLRFFEVPHADSA